MYFSLRTDNEERKEKVSKIVANLPKIFGKDKVLEIRDYEMFTTIELKGLEAYVSHLYVGLGESKHRLYIYNYDNKDQNISIDIDLIETIYGLG